VPVEITFRSQPDGALTGELVVREPGYGTAPLKGRAEGNQVKFKCSFGDDTYHFRGVREGDRLGGTFVGRPSGRKGNWSVVLAGPS